MPRKKTEAEKLLLRRVLEKGKDYSDEELGDAIGISGERVRQYRDGKWSWLQDATKRKFRRYLSGSEHDAPGYTEGRRSAIKEMEEKLAEMRSTLPESEGESRVYRIEDLRNRADETRKSDEEKNDGA